MKILAVDTCSNICSVAIYSDGVILHEKIAEQESKQAELLVPMIEYSLSSAKLFYDDLDAFAVTIGPGAFTGARVGLSTLKGIKAVYDKPLVGVSTLEATAFQAREKFATSNLITVLLDARRSQYYTQTFSNSENLEAFDEPALINVEDITTSKGTASVSNTCLDKASFKNVFFSARDIAKIAVRKIEDDTYGKTQIPLYIRPPDAKLPKVKIS